MQAFAKLSRAAVRVRRVAAQVTKATMADSPQETRPYSTAKTDEDESNTAAILIIGDEILKVSGCKRYWYLITKLACEQSCVRQLARLLCSIMEDWHEWV